LDVTKLYFGDNLNDKLLIESPTLENILFGSLYEYTGPIEVNCPNLRKNFEQKIVKFLVPPKYFKMKTHFNSLDQINYAMSNNPNQLFFFGIDINENFLSQFSKVLETVKYVDFESTNMNNSTINEFLKYPQIAEKMEEICLSFIINTHLTKFLLFLLFSKI
jgi:hypothetical protein